MRGIRHFLLGPSSLFFSNVEFFVRVLGPFFTTRFLLLPAAAAAAAAALAACGVLPGGAEPLAAAHAAAAASLVNLVLTKLLINVQAVKGVSSHL